MTEANISLRKKLSWKKPSKHLKKQKTAIPFNCRDHDLTADQKSWATSLTVSLSGWQMRRSFLEEQHEVHLRAEAEAQAQQDALHAALQAQEDRHRAHHAGLQAEADEKFAQERAAYGKRADELHEAGIELDIDGSDFEEEPYGVNRLHISHNRASERSSRSIVSPSFSSYSASESSSLLYASSPAIPSTSSFSRASFPNAPSPEKERARDPHLRSPIQAVEIIDWRVKARNGIAKKKLSIEKGWSALTWNQKSNVQERRLLLEDDGFEIAALQERKTSSEEITNIVLERAAAKKRPVDAVDDAVDWLVQKDKKPTASSEVQEFSMEELMIRTEANKPSVAESIRGSISEISALLTDTTIAPGPQIMTVSNTLAGHSTKQNVEQPYSLYEPYHPRASHPLKRKLELISTVENEEPVYKKRSVVLHAEKELQSQALQEIRFKVLRRIFRPSRSVCRGFSHPSSVVFLGHSFQSRGRESTKKPSTLSYLYGKQNVAIFPNGPLELQATACDNILDELRFLFGINNETDIEIVMCDPDYEADRLEITIAELHEVTQKLCEQDATKETTNETIISLPQDPRILISRKENSCQVIQGDTLALAEMFKIFHEGTLLHHVDWEWDGLRLNAANLSWSLSPESRETLMEIEHQLRQHTLEGGAKIYVKRIEREQID